MAIAYFGSTFSGACVGVTRAPVAVAADHNLEHVPKYIAVTGAAMTVLGEGRMVRHIAVEA